MQKQIKFVLGAVAKKEIVPALSHFKISNGKIQSFDGRIALCAPIDINLDAIPKAEPFYKAIASCSDNIAISQTPTGKLSIRSGKFRTLVECLTIDETPHVCPTGEIYNIDGKAFVDAVSELYPVIGTDASRPWSGGVLVDGTSAFVTNNVVILQKHLQEPFPVRCVIPRVALVHLANIGQFPQQIQTDGTSLSFLYENNSWIRCQLLEDKWPDPLKILQNISVTDTCLPITEEFWEALHTLDPFVEKMNAVYFNHTAISTYGSAGEEETGASVDFPIGCAGAFNVKILLGLEGIITHADFTTFPAPCALFGNNIRGAIVGLRIGQHAQ